MNRYAQCSCGDLKIITTSEPLAVVICHCLECQRRTGSVFGVGAYYVPENLKIEGHSNFYSRKCDSGETLESNFCPKCGTTLFWKIKEELNSRIGVAVGAFADPKFPCPERSVWEHSQHSWVNTGMISTHYSKGRS